MDFKLVVAVFCLASIRVSEAVLAYSAATGTSTITECVASGFTVPVTQTTSGEAATVTYSLTTQTPDSTTKKFAVSGTTGALTTVTSAASTFDAETQLTYVIRITAADGTTTVTLDITLTITGGCSSASFVFPSLAVILISLISLLMKNNN